MDCFEDKQELKIDSLTNINRNRSHLHTKYLRLIIEDNIQRISHFICSKCWIHWWYRFFSSRTICRLNVKNENNYWNSIHCHWQSFNYTFIFFCALVLVVVVLLHSVCNKGCFHIKSSSFLYSNCKWHSTSFHYHTVCQKQRIYEWFHLLHTLVPMRQQRWPKCKLRPQFSLPF